jgi:two-component system chemotaxis response regulator CheY
MQHFLNSLYLILVEPSTAQTSIITRQFEDLGIEQFVNVSNGADALELISQGIPDLVISATYLPDMSGRDLVHEMRANPLWQDIPFMLISSMTSFAELDPIWQAGASAVLPKPFDATDLRRAINTTVDWESPQPLQFEQREPQNLRVLLVDDSAMARHMISRTLEKMGLNQIDEADSGRQAIPMLQKQGYDLLITDYNMPEMDGHELLLYIRQQSKNPDMPVLMVTTEGDEGKLEAMQQDGVSAIIDKPFAPITVKRLLEALMEPA